MKPEICKNCCANEFIEQDDAYVCAYCNSRYHKAPAKVVTEIRYVEVPVPVSEPAKQEIQTGERKNKWVAFFWCLFMGGFGAHKSSQISAATTRFFLFSQVNNRLVPNGTISPSKSMYS